MKCRLNWVGCWICIAALGMTGCSTRNWYEGMKLGAENDCQKQPPGAREGCLSQLNKKSYEDYEKERASVK